MKIVLVNTLYPPHIGGGAEITLKSLVEGLAVRGHDVTVLTTGPTPGVAEDEVDGIPVLRLGVENGYWHHNLKIRPSLIKRAMWHMRDSFNTAMGKKVADIVRSLKPDLVNCHNLPGFSAAVWPAIKGQGVIVSQVLHDLYNICPNSNMICRGKVCSKQCMLCHLFRLRQVDLSRNVDCVIGVSQFVLDKHLEHGFFPEAKIKTAIHNARAMMVPERQVRQPGAPIAFGFIGTLTRAKGIELLLHSFNSISKQSDARLIVAGRGDDAYVHYLKTMASDRVDFIGYAKPSDFFQMIDVLVVPSLWNDTLPGVVFEGLAHSVPVIGSRRGGIPEMIKHGINGLLFEPDAPGELRATLEAVYDDNLRENLAQKARPSSERFRDVDGWIKAYEELFRHANDSKMTPC